jgi:hypothetical protein
MFVADGKLGAHGALAGAWMGPWIWHSRLGVAVEKFNSRRFNQCPTPRDAATRLETAP